MAAKKSFLISLLIILIAGIYIAVDAKAVTQKQAGGNKIVLEYEFREPIVSSGGEYDSVQMDETQAYERTGTPIVPVRPVRVLIPFGKKVVASKVTALDTQRLSGTYQLAPAQKPYPLSYKGPRERTGPDPAIYGQTKPWPRTDHQEMATQSKRGYQIFTVNLFPLQYTPTTGEIYYTTRLRLEIDLADSVVSNVLRPSEKVKSTLNRMVDNPGAAMETYPSQSGSIQKISAAALPSSGPYQYVIITNEALNVAPGPWNFQALRDAKIAKGVTATIVTTEWIYANYNGTRPDGDSDDQTRIRNFLVDAYQTWGTEYVLLGGTKAIVPARLFWVDSLVYDNRLGEITDNMPADMYYGCVDSPQCTFDYDADGKYAEPTDGVGGGEIDLFAEIYVGRAAVENATELGNFIKKTLTYDSTNTYNKYLPRIAMLGEYLGFGGVSEYATESMEQIRLGGLYDGYYTCGFEEHDQSSFIDFNTQGCLSTGRCWPLYDAPGYSWSKTNLINLMNGGIHIFNHDGHANYTYDMKLDTSDLGSLTNTDYFFAYSQGCMPGGFDTIDCFAEVITSTGHGAFAVVMNARYGWGRGWSTDGLSHRFARQFWDAVLGERILEIGRANQDSKEDNLWDINGECIRYCYYELNLFGDPQQQFRFGPSLMLSKVDDVNDGDCVGPGDEITYTIFYGNPVTDPCDPRYIGTVNDVNIIDYLPNEVEYVSSEPEPNEVLDSNTIIWKVGTLKPWDANSIMLTVRVKYPELGTIRNKCELRSGDNFYNTAYENTHVYCWYTPIIYVDANAAGADNGTSWEDAYKYLQDALRHAQIVLGPCPGEIWVAAGTYEPDCSATLPNGSGNRAATFKLINNVTIYGGFPPGGGVWQDRDPNAYKTILSGDISTIGNSDDNSYHVVTGSSTNKTAVLDGFTVSGGNAYGYNGGGIYSFSGSPKITNCAFTDNSATYYGGGMGNSFGSNPTVTNCTFTDNRASYSGGGMGNEYSSPTITNCTFIDNSAYNNSGGGMYNESDSRPIVTNCTFSGNSANYYGGGMDNEFSSPIVTNCTFSGNAATNNGGGMDNYNSSPTVTNCAFSGNSAEKGSGMCNYYYGSPVVTNCTFSGNSATNNGGGMSNLSGSNPTVTNSILWGNIAPNGPQIYKDGSSSPTVSFSDIQGGWMEPGWNPDDPNNDGLRVNLHFQDNLNSTTTFPTVWYGSPPTRRYHVLRGTLEDYNTSGFDAWQENGKIGISGDFNRVNDELPYDAPNDCYISLGPNEPDYETWNILNFGDDTVKRTWTFWFNTADITQSTFLRHQNIYDNSTFWDIFIKNGKLGFRSNKSICKMQFSTVQDINALGVTPNTWHHVVFVIDRSSQTTNKIYVDGLSVPVEYGTTLPPSFQSGNVNDDDNRSPMSIGGNGTTTLPWSREGKFDGLLDEIRVYHRPLALSEVGILYRYPYTLPPGTGNINVDPCFVDANGSDGVIGTSDDNLRLLSNSPCIDTGDNSSIPPDYADLNGNGSTTEPTPYDLVSRGRITDGNDDGYCVVDIGAYEFLSYTSAYIGDFDNQCDVDFRDFAIFAAAWLTEEGQTNYKPICDIGVPADQKIDMLDLEVFAEHWLAVTGS